MLTDVPGVAVGHYTDLQRGTGCTVIRFEGLCPAAVDVNGGAPGTRETDLLAMGRLVGAVNAIVLAGGSAFGLAASHGVMEHLRSQGHGVATPAGPVPIVASAVIYDLDTGDPAAYPGATEGALASRLAADTWHAVGSVGAGTGARIGRFLGSSRAVKGGLGAASTRFAGGTVAVLVVVNSLGNVLDADRTILAGPRSDDGSFVPYEVLVGQSPDRVGLNTVLTVAVTDLNIDRDLLYHIARSCNAGVAQTVVPAHTLWDGDTAFAVSTRKAGTLPREMAFDLGVIFSQLTAKAIRQAAKEARSVAGIPALTDLRR